MAKKHPQKLAGLSAFPRENGVFLVPLKRIISWEECAEFAERSLFATVMRLGKISEKQKIRENQIILAARFAMNKFEH